MTIRFTPTWQLPYPEAPDHTRTWEYWQGLAEATDARLTVVKNFVAPLQAGSVSIAIAAAAAGSATVTFPKAFTAVPACSANINSGSGASSDWWSRMIGVSTTGASLFIKGPSTTFTFPCQWIAALTPATPVLAGTAAPAPAPQLPEDGWHPVTATCHTSGCPQNGMGVSGLLVPDDPAAWGWSGIVCGVCGQPATDMQARS